MTKDLPIACSLSATEFPQRMAEMADLGGAAMRDSQIDGRQARLRFAAGADVRRHVDAIVAAESQCCAFLAMRVSEEPDAVLLTIVAPEGAEWVLCELVDAFRGQSQAV